MRIYSCHHVKTLSTNMFPSCAVRGFGRTFSKISNGKNSKTLFPARPFTLYYEIIET